MKLFLFFFIGLSLALNARQNRSSSLLDELRLELSDIKHELHSARVDISLLEEKMSKQQQALHTHAQESVLEKKSAQLEKTLEKLLSDVRALNDNVHKAWIKIQDTELACSALEKKYEDILKLKGTLANISKAIGQKTVSSVKTHIVKAGDSLEKIARLYHTTVEAIKQLNQLPDDKIFIQQELQIP